MAPVIERLIVSTLVTVVILVQIGMIGLIWNAMKKIATHPAQRRMDELILDIIKYKYLHAYCNNILFDREKYDRKWRELNELERSFPALKRFGTPTEWAAGVFVDRYGINAFGGKVWEELKTTWNLLKIDIEDE